MNSVSVRVARASDYDAVDALFEGADRRNHDFLPHIYKMPVRPIRTFDYLVKSTETPGSTLLVAEEGDAVVGILRLAVQPAPIVLEGKIGAMAYLFVEESRRGRGIGGALVEHGHEWVRSEGARRVDVNVLYEDAKSCSFFERYGYQRIGQRRNLMLSNVEATDDPRVREATADDYSAVSELLFESMRFHHDVSPDEYAPAMQPGITRDAFESSLANEGETILLAETNDLGAVGVVRVFERPSLSFVGGRYGMVVALHVVDSARHRHLGQALMEYSHWWLKERGAPRVELAFTLKNPQAAAFYDHLGYETTFWKFSVQLP
ncbi:MAG: GNAT family N-acetyltransferase [Candidatus Poribacteria bacterium]|nr:GNAT family N-acetyltransferase [Candidatus Poribacteria bacterium]